MYLESFGFSEKPFHITPNPRFIFLSKNHKEAFAHLLYGIQQRVGFLSLSGEIGTGKTTVLRTLLGQLEDAEYKVALIFNPCLSALELLQTIHREFGIDYDADSSNMVALHDSLNRFLLKQRTAGKTVVLVIDEAQNLDPKVLEELRLLSNLETETEKLIQMVLVGQPELDEILQRNDLRQLRQRLVVSYHLRAMDAEDTRAYVQHRVKVAGCRERALFAAPALDLIYRYSGGTPRLVNLLCDRSLLVAYGHDGESVTKQDVQTAQRELQQQQRKTFWPKVSRIGFGLVALILVMLLLKLNFFITEADIVESRVATPVVAPLPEPDKESRTAEAEAAGELKPLPVAEDWRTLLLQRVAELSVEESGLQATMAIAELWQQALPSQLPAIHGRHSMERSLASLGLEVVDFQGSLAELLRMNSPVVLELTLPAVTGKRFVALVQSDGERVKTLPEVSDDGWLTYAELRHLWFGKALLPYLDFKNIPLLGRLGAEGDYVAELQQLLARVEPDSLDVTSVYDEATINAVVRFQQQMQLAPDGRVGSQTLFWLYHEAGFAMPKLSEGAGS